MVLFQGVCEVKEDTIHWPPDLSQKPAEKRFLWRKDLSLVRQVAPTSSCTCACQLNLPVQTVGTQSQKQAVTHTQQQNHCKLPGVSCFANTARAHLSSITVTSPANRPRALKYHKRGPSVNPYAPLKTCNCCLGRALGNLPTAGEPSIRALTWTDLFFPVAFLTEMLRQHQMSQTRLQTYCASLQQPRMLLERLFGTIQFVGPSLQGR